MGCSERVTFMTFILALGRGLRVLIHPFALTFQTGMSMLMPQKKYKGPGHPKFTDLTD